MLLDKWDNCFGEGLSSGGFVGGDGGWADEDFVFGKVAVGRNSAGDGEGRGVGRMAVNDGAGFGVGLEDFEVKQQFAGEIAVADEDFSVEIGEADIGGLKIGFAQQRWRAEQVIFADADADVAAVAVDVLALPELASDADNLGAD